jgi:hypothetical protein
MGSGIKMSRFIFNRKRLKLGKLLGIGARLTDDGDPMALAAGHFGAARFERPRR